MLWLWVALLLVFGLSLPAGLVAVGVDAERGGKEEPLHRNHTTNLHPRYQTGSKRAVKEQRLLVQISITSSPHRAHLRAAGAFPASSVLWPVSPVLLLCEEMRDR